MQPVNPLPITVLGAGSWGTALAITLARNGHFVRLWGHNAIAMANMAATHCNSRYLPDIQLPDNLLPLADIAAAIEGVHDIIIAVPSHAFRHTLEMMKPYAQHIRVCSATKGLEPQTSKLLHTVVKECLGQSIPFAVLSGPSFAHEVALGLPTAITLATYDQQFGQDLSLQLHNANFRVYTCSDVLGVQLGGAIKNVLAIAAGISDGLGFGANARSALITRGLTELVRLGLMMGGKLETFMGLAGIGDLVLTCTDNQSRNRRFGLALGQGKTVEQAEASIGQVVEGLKNAKEVYQLAVNQHIEMPITEQIYNILYRSMPVREAATQLLARTPKAEHNIG